MEEFSKTQSILNLDFEDVMLSAHHLKWMHMDASAGFNITIQTDLSILPLCQTLAASTNTEETTATDILPTR